MATEGLPAFGGAKGDQGEKAHKVTINRPSEARSSFSSVSALGFPRKGMGQFIAA